MINAEIAGLIEGFKTIITITERIVFKSAYLLSSEEATKIKATVEEFNNLVRETNDVSRKLGSSFRLSMVLLDSTLIDKNEAIKATIEIQSRASKAMAFLEKAMVPTLSKDQIDTLRSLKDELSKVEDVNCQRNLLKAIEEFEQAHHLASALIASRVIVYVLEKIPGKNDEEKIDKLFQKGLVSEKKEDVRSSLLRVCRLARNALSHRIEIFPDPDEALSILANSVTLSKLEAKLKSAFQSS